MAVGREAQVAMLDSSAIQRYFSDDDDNNRHAYTRFTKPTLALDNAQMPPKADASQNGFNPRRGRVAAFFYMTQSLSRKRVLFSCRVPVRGQAEGNESGHASKALTDYRGTCAKHCFNSGRRDMSSRRTQCLTGKPGAVGELQIGFGQRLRLGKSKWRCCFRLRAGNEDESTRNGKENKAVVGQAHTKLIPTQHQA